MFTDMVELVAKPVAAAVQRGEPELLGVVGELAERKVEVVGAQLGPARRPPRVGAIRVQLAVAFALGALVVRAACSFTPEFRTD